MNTLFRSIFTVQHQYRDPEKTARARQLIPLAGSMALLALVYGVFLLISAVTGLASSANIPAQTRVTVPVVIVWSVLTSGLIQRGYVNAGAVLIALLLGLVALVSLYADGITPSPLATLPIFMVYMGMVYGSRGIILAIGLIWAALPLTASLQRNGDLATSAGKPHAPMHEALVSAGMFTLTALLLWLFAWNLEHTLSRLTRIASQTRATASIGQTFSRILNLDELLTNAVDLIRDRFAFYHAQVYLTDDARTYANLAASTGELGQALLAQGFRVSVDGRTVVGDTVSTGEGHYVPDITETMYRHPELLANTRSELVLPLTAGQDILGALDIHSTRSDAFSVEDIEGMRIIAGQLAQSIQNARLFEAQQRSLLQNRRLFLESETNLREIERLNRQLTGQSWQEYLLERGVDQFSVSLSGDTFQTGETEWTPAMQQAVERRRMVSQNKQDEQLLAVPISIRGQSIGAIEIQLASHQNQAEVRSILQAVTERIAFSLENARLFEQARMAAEREQQINLIAARLQGLNSVDDVLATAVSALGEVLGAEYGAIRLIEPDVLPEVKISSRPVIAPGESPPRNSPTRSKMQTGMLSLPDSHKNDQDEPA